MNKVHSHIWIFMAFCLSISSVVAQDDVILAREINLKFNENTLIGHVDNLLIQENISLAFNSSRVDLKELIILPKKPMLLEDLVRKLFYNDEIKLTSGHNKVLITFVNKVEDALIRVRGHILDKETGEPLAGASIAEMNSYSTTFSNESGFFSLAIPRDSSEVRFSYLGYESVKITEFEDIEIDVFLDFDNELTQVVIKESISDNFISSTGGVKIDLALTEGFQSTDGSNDLLKSVQINAGVQSGNEGQSGFLVRGGSQDQNLILFEGVPLYEVSHAAGFSSMFIEESLRNVDLIKNGFPARYGGRLSSVLNVQLKDGNKSDVHGSVSASLPSMKAHIEGPILGGKTTFNLSGRLSYLNRYIDQTIGNYINYDIDLNYNDFVAKVTHKFSPGKKMSASYYKGGDNLGIFRDITDLNNDGDSFSTSGDVDLQWGSQVWNVNFSNIVNDKLQLRFNLGGVDYKYTSRGAYTFESVIDSLPSDAEFEIVSFSEINDVLANVNFDYYITDKHVLKFGAGWISHNYRPGVRSSQVITTEIVTEIENEEERIKADELSAYIEDTYTPSDNWQFYIGFHFAGYNVGTTQYRNTQPRLSAIYMPGNNDRINLSYTKMNQYVHLLVNPGIGLPTNLWVPSTDDIEPESADQLSLSYSRRVTNSINFSVSGFYKKMKNLIEYRSAVDLIFLGGTNQINLPLQEDDDWQKRVEVGESTSKGLEFELKKTTGTWRGWFGYTLSKTDRVFESIDNGEPFPFKYDRRHDISTGIKYIINKKCSFSGNWAYGTGDNFSLSLEGFRSPFGNLVTVGKRNNYRQESFHHLDIQFNYVTNFDRHGKFSLQVGLYNIYNRKNPYFIYIYESPALARAEARKTSLFPILPNINLGYSF